MIAARRPAVHHSNTCQLVEVSAVSEEKRTPDEPEVDEAQLEEVAGGIGTWPTPERTLRSNPKTTEPLDKKLTDSLDKDTLNR